MIKGITESEVWEFFEENADKLADEVQVIAENPLTGVEIMLEVEDGYPVISVALDSEVLCQEPLLNPSDAKETAERLFKQYLSDEVFFDWDANVVPPSSLDEKDAIEEREIELDDAVWYLLQTFAPNLIDFFDDGEVVDKTIEELKDFFGAYLYGEHGISIYRPMFINKDGEEVFCEYPYPHLK